MDDRELNLCVLINKQPSLTSFSVVAAEEEEDAVFHKDNLGGFGYTAQDWTR